MRCASAQASVRAEALPADASCEDLEVDPALPFLDAHVAAALAAGAAPYMSEEQRFAMGAVRPSHHDEACCPSSASSWLPTRSEGQGRHLAACVQIIAH